MTRAWILGLLAIAGLGAVVGGLVWWTSRAADDAGSLLEGRVADGKAPGGDERGIAPERPDTAHVILELVDDTGAPVVGALIVIDGQAGTASDGWAFGAVGQRTDGTGRAIFRSVPFGRWPIYVPGPQFEPLGRKAIAIDGEQVPAGTTLEFEIPLRRRRVVRAAVRDSAGETIPFLDLDLLVTAGNGDRWHQASTTDAEGSFEVFVPQQGTSVVQVRVSSPGYRATDAATFELDPAEPDPSVEVIVATNVLHSFG